MMYQLESSLARRKNLVVREYGLRNGVKSQEWSTHSGATYRICKCFIACDHHPGTGREPNHAGTHVDEDEVVLSVIQLL